MRHLIAVAALLLVTAVLAIEPPQPDPKAPKPAAEKPVAEKPAAPEAKPDAPPAGGDAPQAQAQAQAEEEEETLPPLPPEAANAGPAPQRFTPSEKVRADFPVSFPIDI